MQQYAVFNVSGMIISDKRPMSALVSEGFRQFKNSGGKLVVITGAPLQHVPKELFSFPGAILLAEHGAVQWKNGDTVIAGETEAIKKIKSKLGITVQDGLQKIDEGTVIIEGPRLASLTLLFGTPSHYAPNKATADASKIHLRIEQIIAEEALPVSVWPGHDGNYGWLDLILTTKKKTIQRLIADGTLPTPFFYLGDKSNDFEVMQLDGAIPVAFPNCTREIIDLAKKKGIQISRLPFTDGIQKFFNIIINGKM